MSKIIFWIVVVFVVLFVLRLWNTSKLRARNSKKASAAPQVAQAMVKCGKCGVFLPAPDARNTPDGFRCSDPHCAGASR